MLPLNAKFVRRCTLVTGCICSVGSLGACSHTCDWVPSITAHGSLSTAEEILLGLELRKAFKDNGWLSGGK